MASVPLLKGSGLSASIRYMETFRLHWKFYIVEGCFNYLKYHPQPIFMGLLRRPRPQMLTSAGPISTLCPKTNLTKKISHNSDNFLLLNILSRLHIHKSIWTTISSVLHPCHYLTNISALDTIIWICLHEQIRIWIIFRKIFHFLYL